MICSQEFDPIECPKIDPWNVDAFFELSLDSINPSLLQLNTSWGCTTADLSGAVKGNETITHLFLSPTKNPTSLQYNREDYGVEGAENGGVDCITGDALSRIISMRLLKDVAQDQPIQNGNVYMWNSITNQFEPYDLMTFVNETNTTLENHTNAISQLQADVTAIKNSIELLTKRVTNLENRMTAAETNIENLLQRMTTAENNIVNLQGRVSNIEGAIYNWAGDKTTKIPRGVINIYGDPDNNGTTTQSILSHSPSINVKGDQRYA